MHGIEGKDRQEVAVSFIRKYGGGDIKVQHSSVTINEHSPKSALTYGFPS